MSSGSDSDYDHYLWGHEFKLATFDTGTAEQGDKSKDGLLDYHRFVLCTIHVRWLCQLIPA